MTMLKNIKRTAFAAGVAATLATTGQAQNLTGQIEIDGSSTVFPITQAVAEEFMSENANVRITVGVSGTGGGFKRFADGETDISDASRPVKPSEAATCATNEVSFIEVPVAYDGLTIVVNRENTWVDQLTIAQLQTIFLAENQARVTTWQDVNPAWPAVAISIYSPGTDSGTFDYFKEVVAHGDQALRSDMSVSEDDNVLVRGVTGNRGGIGYFGCAYYFENQETLRAVPIVNGAGNAVVPSAETIENGTYEPFARPLFIYVNSASLNRPEVAAFVQFYLAEGGELAEEVGYVRLPDAVYDRAEANIRTRRLGTQYTDANGEKVQGPVTEVYQ